MTFEKIPSALKHQPAVGWRVHAQKALELKFFGGFVLTKKRNDQFLYPAAHAKTAPNTTIWSPPLPCTSTWRPSPASRRLTAERDHLFKTRTEKIVYLNKHLAKPKEGISSKGYCMFWPVFVYVCFDLFLIVFYYLSLVCLQYSFVGVEKYRYIIYDILYFVFSRCAYRYLLLLNFSRDEYCWVYIVPKEHVTTLKCNE